MLLIPAISRSSFKGEISLPVSKSLANRMMVINALSGFTRPDLPENISNDVKVLYRAMFEAIEPLDFEDAGTPLRFYLAYASISKDRKQWISGSARLKERPVKPLLKALESLGAEFEFKDQKYGLPLRIIRPLDLSKSEVEIEAGISSQFISALLLIAPFFERGLDIHLQGEMRSEPYVVMTIDCLRKYNVDVEYRSNGIRVNPIELSETNRQEQLNFEGDWSSASFMFGLAAESENCDLILNNLKLDTTQGDKICSDIYRKLGVETIRFEDGVRISKVGNGNAELNMDFRHFPDLFPPILVSAIMKGMHGTFKGVRTLRDKESDRIEAMISNLRPLGVQFIESEDELKYDARRVSEFPEEIKIRCFGDHRVAMAGSLLAFKSRIVIDQPETVLKSFPDYWKVFEKLSGVVTQEIPE